MSQLLAIRDRIKTIKNLHQVTTAMELVTRTKINHIRQNAMNARQYCKTVSALFATVAPLFTPENNRGKVTEENTKHCLIGFLAQKGFCGNFSEKALGKLFIRLAPLRMHKNVHVVLAGRRNSKWDYVLKRPFDHIEASERSYRQEFAPQVKSCVANILSGMRMEIYFIYNEYKTILQQNPVVKQVFPYFPEPDIHPLRSEVFFDQDMDTLRGPLLKAYLEAWIEQVYWESLYGEYCSRLITMKNANDNASMIIDDLRLVYNKTRQTKITQELSEIVSAFDVLKMLKAKREEQQKAA